MKNNSATAAARQFLSVTWDGPAPNDVQVLAELDRLIAAYHDTPDVDPTGSDVEASREDYNQLYELAGSRFPNYGYYQTADPAAASDKPVELTLGDAIDDLVDITLDMSEVVWLEDNASVEDAIWSFKLLFFHWGRHARGLGLYLHLREFE